MAHTVSIINGKAPSGGVGGVSDADLSNIAVNFLSPGVVGSNDYKIEQQGTPNMTVKVNIGKAYVFNAALSMAYQTYLDAVGSGTITSNASGNPRIDAVVVKVDLGATPNNLASNVATIVVVAGTPAASPVAPTDGAIQSAVGSGNPFYRLANVSVANGAASITTGNISDTRVRTSLNTGTGGGGWTDYTAVTPTSGTLDDPTYELSFAGVDLTSTLSVGMRVKIIQGSVKYGIITKIAFSTNTTVTIYMGTDYDLVSTGTTSITAFSYSSSKAPLGFPIDPIKWTETLRDTTDRSQSSPVSGTWYNLGSLSLSIPLGAWRVWYTTINQANTTSAPTIFTTLSTANNSESDPDFTSVFSASHSAALNFTSVREKQIVLAAKTTHYLNAKYTGTATALSFLGSSYAPTILKAVCAYL